METTENIKDMLIMSYQVAFVKDNYRINVYLYDSCSYHKLLHKYYDNIPRCYLAMDPSLTDIDHLQLESGDEFVIMINGDRLSESERVAVLVEDLYIVADDIADMMDSEEFAARVLDDVFNKTAPLLCPDLNSTGKSSKIGLAADEFAVPLINENYRVTLNVFDSYIITEVLNKLREKYWQRIAKGEFDPSSFYGFMVDPDDDELAVFINSSRADTLLLQETILVHELFHASKRLAERFEGESSSLGSKICRTLFKQFVVCLESTSEPMENGANNQ